MNNLEEIKRNWKGNTEGTDLGQLDKKAWENLLRQQVKKQKNISMQYFWASFTYQVIVYGFLGHVILKHWDNQMVVIPSVFCLLLYVPFTVVLMHRFKRMAVLKQKETLASDKSIKEYVVEQYRLLRSFYMFKTRYEIMLVPLSSATFVWIIFRLYVPGGVFNYPKTSILLFILIVGACSIAILAENKRNFRKPMKNLKEAIRDMDVD